MQGHPIGRARAALRALHRAQRSGELDDEDVEAYAESGGLEVSSRPAAHQGRHTLGAMIPNDLRNRDQNIKWLMHGAAWVWIYSLVVQEQLLNADRRAAGAYQAANGEDAGQGEIQGDRHTYIVM